MSGYQNDARRRCESIKIAQDGTTLENGTDGAIDSRITVHSCFLRDCRQSGNLAPDYPIAGFGSSNLECMIVVLIRRVVVNHVVP